ncbi:MAG: murein biosynthesis integral membrane protein MurJ [Firmicutes bacterium]|nr:murein biosynthesis integral membrane protein MurJ [Bacillota bacterium]
MAKDKGAKSIILAAGFMAAATFAAKALGLIRDMLVAAYFGTGAEADAYMLATKIPTTLFDAVVGGVISASLIPIFSDALKKEEDPAYAGESRRFSNRFITLVVLVTLIIVTLGIIFADPLVSFMAPDFDAETHSLSVNLTIIMFPMLIFTGFAFSFVGILQSYGEYIIPSIISFVSNVVIILYFLIFGERFGVYGLAVTMIAAWSLQMLVQIPALRKFGFRWRPDFHFRDENISRAAHLALPMLVSTWIQPLSSIVNSRFASHISGTYSSLEYANRLYVTITGIFSFVVTNLVYPKLAAANSGGDESESRGLTSSSIKAVVLIIAPLSLGVMTLSSPIVSVIYEHGELSSSDAVASALTFYSFGMLFYALNEVFSKAFFARKQSKIPMICSLIGMAVNFIVVFVSFEFINDDAETLTAGLAFAVSCGSAVTAALSGGALLKSTPGLLSGDDVKTIVKALLSAVVMGGVVSASYGAVGYFVSFLGLDGILGQLLLCAVIALIGVIIYGLMLVILRVREVRELLALVTRRLK